MFRTLKTMTYKEFLEYCNDRACDGRWGFDEAVTCLSVIDEINAIKVKTLGFTRKKKTEQAQEEAWRKMVSQL